MSNDPSPDITELRRQLALLPERVRTRIARAWTREWAAAAYAAAVREAPIGKTRNLVAGIRMRHSRKAVLTRLASLSRSVVIGAKPAYHYHLVVLGTKPRFTKGKKTGKTAYRGVMPRNPFPARSVSPLIGQATADLRQRVSREVSKFFRRRATGG